MKTLLNDGFFQSLLFYEQAMNTLKQLSQPTTCKAVMVQAEGAPPLLCLWDGIVSLGVGLGAAVLPLPIATLLMLGTIKLKLNLSDSESLAQ